MGYDDKAEMVLARKPTENILAMCKAATNKKGGVESQLFLDAALEQSQFLSMEPKVESNVFPPFIRLAAKRQRSRAAR